MARLTPWRAGAIVLAAGLLIAACSGGSGGPGPVDSNILPSGIAGGSTGAHGSQSASKSGKATGSHTASGSASAGSSSTPSSRHRGGGGTSTAPGSHPSTSSKPGDNGCQSSAPPHAGDPSMASITVCPAVGLKDGQTVTITGSHFHPTYLNKPEGVLYMECHYKNESAGNYGAADCNINPLEVPSPKCSFCKVVNSDGTIVPFQLQVHILFKSKAFGAKPVDCSTVQCMITVAQPVQSSDADNPHVLISFG